MPRLGCRERFPDDLGTVDRDQFTAVVTLVIQLVLFDAQRMQNGRVQVLWMHRSLDGGVTDRIGRANHLATANTAAGEPHGVTGRRVVPAGIGPESALGSRRSAEFAAPNHQGLVEQSAAMYGIQGLWTAARYRIPVTFIVANNREYRILKVCGQVLEMPDIANGASPGLDLGPPAIDFVGLARSLGVAAHRVADADELSERIRANLFGPDPLLLEVPCLAE